MSAPASSSTSGSKRFLEFFCGTKCSRSEAKKVYPFLPLTPGGHRRKAAPPATSLDLISAARCR